MIVYDLTCEGLGHRFEGWFGSSQDFDSQQARGLVTCPHCGSAQVSKAVMAPRLTRKGNQQGEAAPVAAAKTQESTPPVLPREAQAALHALATLQAEALKSSRWVGQAFAQDARAMHYGDRAAEPIHGQTTPEEARALAEEGVAITPVLFPLAPPDEIN
jgi:hypothetical protein